MTRARLRAGLPSPSGGGVGGEGRRAGHLRRIQRGPSSGASRHLLPEGEGTTANVNSETMHCASSRGTRRVLIIACGALAREVLALKLDVIDVACLPGQLHNYPKQIPDAMRAKIRANRAAYDEILCLYGDCGTGGELDRVLAEEEGEPHRRRALLRILCERGGVFGARGRRAGHVLPHRFSGPPFRRARHSGSRPRSVS